MHHHDGGPSRRSFEATQICARRKGVYSELTGHRKVGPRVRRQHPLWPFIVDFFVPAYALAIEVDGGLHRFQREHDRRRDRQLAAVHGVRVLRIDAELVERNVLAAVAIVRATL